MSLDYRYCDKMIDDFEKVVKNPIKTKSKVFYTGVDLGRGIQTGSRSL